MSIIHLINSDPINNSELCGINNVVYNLAINQSNKCKVEICGITHLATSQLLVNSNLTYHNIKRNWFRTSLLIYLIRNKLIFFDKEIIYHFHNVYVFEYFLIALLLKREKIRWVMSPHNGFHPLRFNKMKIFNYYGKKLYIFFFESFLINNAFKIHATGPQEEIQLRNFLPYKAIQLIPNGVSVNHNSTNTVPKREEGVIIGFFGRLEIEAKALDILLQSIKLMIQKRKDLRLHLIGYGPDETKLKNMVEKLALQNYVSFLGPKFGDEKFVSLNQLDYYIQLSRYESFPITILEAASTGLPLILSKGCGFNNLIAEHRNGIVIETDSIDLIAESVLDFINSTDDSTYKEMCRNSINLVKENYTWDKIVPKFSELLYC